MLVRPRPSRSLRLAGALWVLLYLLGILWSLWTSIFPSLGTPPFIPGDIVQTPWVRDCNCGFRNCRCEGRTIDIETIVPPAQATLVGEPIVTAIPGEMTPVTVPTVATATAKPEPATPTYPPTPISVTPSPISTPEVPTAVPQTPPTPEPVGPTITP